MGKLSIIASGDLMLLERFPLEYDCKNLHDIISKADVRITNLENVVSKGDCYASTFCGGQWINSLPENLTDVQKYGFNVFSCANNHSMDFSVDGIRSTCNELEKRNIPYAGIGLSLTDSSKPVFFDTENAQKIALISVTTTFIDAARAGDSKDSVPSRPGVNPLRIKTKFIVSHERINQLKEIAQVTYINGERDNARKIGSLPPEEPGSINFGGHFFVETEDGSEGKYTYCDDRDLRRILAEIDRAKEVTPNIIVCVHSHQIKHGDYFEPDYFLEEFAHKCIDRGAIAIIGGGTHQLKPIEIYKSKPIFYSLGNFVFQLNKVSILPADFWDKYDYNPNLSISECLAIKSKNGKIGLETDRSNYISILPYIEFNHGKLTKVEIFPVELNFYGNDNIKGLPKEASQEDVYDVFEQLKRISKSYGTELQLVNKSISVVL